MFRMFRKMICLVSFVLVLGIVVDVQAGEVYWTDDGPDHLWSTPANWEGGTIPTPADRARTNKLPGPIVADDVLVNMAYAGFSGDAGAITVDGGTLTTKSFCVVGRMTGDNGTLNMISGTINVGSTLYVGHEGTGTLNMTGGNIAVKGSLTIAAYDTGTGHVNLNGGIITINDINMRSEAGAIGTMDVRAGTLIINEDKLSTVQGYIDNGWITAYDGDGTLQLDYDVTNEGQTTLKATHFLNPNPVDGSLVTHGEVELSWTLPDTFVPGQPVSVDVYFSDDLQLLEQFTDPAAIQVVSKQNVTSVAVQTQVKTRYYWAIDTYIGDPNDPIFGPIFSFFTDNLHPEVDAGADITTWLEEGTKTRNLDATVTDDGLASPYTVQWMVVSEPNDPNNPDAVIDDPSAEDTSITLSALGEYVLQLEAFDGEYTSMDTVTINVYNDSCEAAQSLPDYEPFPGDLNGDCIVDDLDLAILQEDWLKDNSLIEE